jgi:hypothetical protein
MADLFSIEANEECPRRPLPRPMGALQGWQETGTEANGDPSSCQACSLIPEYENVRPVRPCGITGETCQSSRAVRPDVCEGWLIEPALSRGTVPAKHLPWNSIQGVLASQYLSAASRTGIRIDSRYRCAVYFGCVSPACSGVQRPGTLMAGE